MAGGRTGNKRKKISSRDKASLLRAEITANYREPLTIPSRYLKFVVAIFLLPLAWMLTEAFFSCFTRAAIGHRFWASEEFWFFSLGIVLWIIAFFGLPKPLLLYVFGHELTHAVWVWLMGGKVSEFEAGPDGGHIVTDKTNFFIALAPYFFPLYSLLVIAIWGGLSFFWDVQPYREYLFCAIGLTWAFNFSFTLWMIPKGQSDLSDHGTFFSLVVIYLMNLLFLAVFLIIASPDVSLRTFGSELFNSAINLAYQIRLLVK